MPSRWSRRAAFPLVLLSGALLMVLVAPREDGQPCGRGKPLSERRSCARVGGEVWSPLPGVDYTGLLIIDLPIAARGGMQLVVGDALPLEIEARTDAGPLPIGRQRLPHDPAVGVPADLWLEAGGPWGLPRHLVRVTISSRVSRAETVEIALGRRAPRVLARLIGYPAGEHATVCAGWPDWRGVPRGGSLEIPAGDRDYFAAGWLAAEPDARGAPIRRMRSAGAVLVPSAEAGRVRVQVRAEPSRPERGEGPLLSLHVNEVWEGAETPLRSGVGEYDWLVPAEAWVVGINELLLRASRPATDESESTLDSGVGLRAVVISAAGTPR